LVTRIRIIGLNDYMSWSRRRQSWFQVPPSLGGWYNWS
jgi:hypothetical protein